MQQRFLHCNNPYTCKMIKITHSFGSCCHCSNFYSRFLTVDLLYCTKIHSSRTVQKFTLSLLTANLSHNKNLLSLCWQLISRTEQKFNISLLTANLSHCTKIYCLFVDSSRNRKIYYRFVDFWFLPVFKIFYDFLMISLLTANLLHCTKMHCLFVDSWSLALYTNLLYFCWHDKTCVLCVDNFHSTLL